MRRIKKLIALNAEWITASIERRKFIHNDKEYWKAFPSKVQEDSQPVFVLSTGRCGTELLTNALKLDKAALVHHAPFPELVYLDRWAYERKQNTIR